MQKWNIKTLKELRKKYKILVDKEVDISKQLEYTSILGSIDAILCRYNELSIGIDIQSHPKLDETLKSDEDLISYHSDYMPILREFNFVRDKIFVHPNTLFDILPFSKNNLFNTSDNFYESVGSVFLDRYLELIKYRKDNLYIRKSASVNVYGLTYCVYGKNISFIELGLTHTVQDYVTLIHEYGHAIGNSINAYATWDSSKYVLLELPSIFFEILGTMFVGDNLDLEDDSYNLILGELTDYLLATRRIITKLDMYGDVGFESLLDKSFYKKYASKELGLESKDIKDLMYIPISEDFHYIISYLTAIELVLIYKSDKKEALRLLNLILIDNEKSPNDYLKYIRSLGIFPGKNIDAYLELVSQKGKEIKSNNLVLKKH